MSDDKEILAICVPTYLRPRMLRNCLAKLALIDVPDNYRVIIFVVDNDEAGSARETFEASGIGNQFEAVYAVENERGLGQVRNRCLDEVTARGASLMAFIDDDEFPEPDWLVLLLAAMKEFDAPIVRGPVLQIPWEEVETFDLTTVKPKWTRKTGDIIPHVNTNNAIFDVKLAIEHNLRFDPFFRFVAGEDHDFFEQMIKLSGRQAIWCADAIVYEAEVAERRTLRYRLARSYKGGAANVAKYRRRNSLLKTEFYFAGKALTKLVAGLLKVLFGLVSSRRRIITGLRDWASALGYLAGMTGWYTESYRITDGN